MTPLPTPSVLSRFSQIMANLRAVVAARAFLPKFDRLVETALPGPLVTRVWNHLRRVEAQLLALAEALRTGRLRTCPNRRSPPPRTTPRAVPETYLPRRFAWLCALAPYRAAPFGGHLQLLLAEPEMQALIAATPRAARILRPLCRMLGIEPARLIPASPATQAHPIPPPRAPRVSEATPPASGHAPAPTSPPPGTNAPW